MRARPLRQRSSFSRFPGAHLRAVSFFFFRYRSLAAAVARAD
jgi:hypothetical protein